MSFISLSRSIVVVILILIAIQVNAQDVPNKSIYFKTIPPIEGEIPEWVQAMYVYNPNVWEVDRLYQQFYNSNEFLKTTHTQNYKF